MSDTSVNNNPVSVKSRGPIALGCAIAFLSASWITLILRAYVRARVLNAVGWDDWTMLATLIVYTGFCAVLMKIVSLGGGSSGASFDELNSAVYVSKHLRSIYAGTNMSSMSSLA